MSFAPVAPPQLLLELKKQGLFGNYHLLLAHDVKAQADLYKEIFADRRKGDGVFVILDNSLIELGYPADINTIAEAAEIVKPDCVVLPDHLGDYKQTVAASAEAVEAWKGFDLPPFLGVVQGNNLGEYMDCAKALIQMGCDFLSVPRVATQILGSRVNVVQSIFSIHRVRMHLLGFSNVRFFDDLMSAKMPGVMGIDSAVPIRLGHQNITMTQQACSTVGPRGTYWEDCTELTHTISHNLGVARGWFNV